MNRREMSPHMKELLRETDFATSSKLRRMAQQFALKPPEQTRFMPTPHMLMLSNLYTCIEPGPYKGVKFDTLVKGDKVVVLDQNLWCPAEVVSVPMYDDANTRFGNGRYLWKWRDLLSDSRKALFRVAYVWQPSIEILMKNYSVFNSRKELEAAMRTAR